MGEVLYSAFCQGDQTIRRGKVFLFLKFECLQEWIKAWCSAKKVHYIQKLNVNKSERDDLVRFLDDSRFNVSFVNENG